MRLDAYPEAILIHRDSGEIVDANSRACQVLLFSREQLRTIKLQELLPAGDEFVNRCLSSVGSEVWTDAAIVRADGHYIKTRVFSSRLEPGLIQTTVREGADLVHAEKALAFVVEFERLLAVISARFDDEPEGGLRHQLDLAVQSLGEFTEVDSCCLFLFDKAQREIRDRHWWNVDPDIDQAVFDLDRVDQFPYEANKLRWFELEHQPGGASEASEAWKEKRDILRSLGFKSLISIPLLSGHRSIGCLVFANRSSDKSWSADLVVLLNIAAQTLANALERLAARDSLRRRVEVEHLISRISSRFLSATSEEIDAAINDALRRLGEFAGVDRAFVYNIDDDISFAQNTHEWCAPGVGSQIERLQYLQATQFPWMLKQVMERAAVRIPHVERLPDAATPEREFLQALDIGGLVIVPRRFQGKLVGMVGFNDVREGTEWSAEDVTLLTIVGEIITNTLQRGRVEEDLRTAKVDLELRVKERTSELAAANDQLTSERLTLQKKNLALREILEQFEESKKQMAFQVQSNVEKVAMPILDSLAGQVENGGQHHLLMLRSCLADLTSPFVANLDRRFSQLTPREVEICNMIRTGFSSKEIAATLKTSAQTVLKQRKIIRRKLGIAKKKTNLASFLNSMQ